jgi:hypothetical protein
MPDYREWLSTMPKSQTQASGCAACCKRERWSQGNTEEGSRMALKKPPASTNFHFISRAAKKKDFYVNYNIFKSGMVAYACNHNTQEAEAGGCLHPRPA